MKNSHSRRVPKGGVVCRNPSCEHQYHFKGGSCEQKKQNVAVKTFPRTELLTTTIVTDGEVGAGEVNVRENGSINSAFEVLSTYENADRIVEGENFNPLTFIQTETDVVDFAPANVSEDDAYTVSDVETMWDISLTDPPTSQISPPPATTHTSGQQQWYTGGTVHRYVPHAQECDKWWVTNLDNLLTPIWNGRNINVEELVEALEKRTDIVGGLTRLHHYLIEKIGSAETVDEEIRYIKLLSTIWHKNAGEQRIVIKGEKIPIYLYQQILQSGDAEAISNLNYYHIKPLERIIEEGGDFDEVFPNTPLTKHLGLTLDKSSAETLVEDYTARVKKLISEKSRNAETVHSPERLATFSDTSEVKNILKMTWQGGDITEDETLKKMEQLDRLDSVIASGGQVRRKDVYSVLEGTPPVSIDRACEMIPESRIDELYASGSLREKKAAINAVKDIDKVYTMLTNIPTRSEGRELSRKERKDMEEGIVKSVLFGSLKNINENSLQHIIHNWGHNPEVNKYLTNFINASFKGSTGLTSSQLVNMFGKSRSYSLGDAPHTRYQWRKDMLEELEKRKRKSERKPFLRRIAGFFN